MKTRRSYSFPFVTFWGGLGQFGRVFWVCGEGYAGYNHSYALWEFLDEYWVALFVGCAYPSPLGVYGMEETRVSV